MLEDTTPPKISSYSLTSDLPSNRPSAPRKGKRRAWLWVTIAILVLALVMTGLFVRAQLILRAEKKAAEAKQKEDPLAQAQEQRRVLLDELGKMIVLPTDEEPTLATVTDLNELKNQPFFANAQLGDKAFFYDRSKVIILYRPNEHKIIEAITELQTVQPEPTTPPAETPATSTPPEGN